MAIEDRTAEGGSLDRIAIATAGHMPAGEDKLQRLPRLAKQCQRTAAKSLGAVVLLDLGQYLGGVLLAVKVEENLSHQFSC